MPSLIVLVLACIGSGPSDMSWKAGEFELVQTILPGKPRLELWKKDVSVWKIQTEALNTVAMIRCSRLSPFGEARIRKPPMSGRNVKQDKMQGKFTADSFYYLK